MICASTSSDLKRVRGNELFQRKEYDRAVHSYQKGLQMIQNFLDEVCA